ncbi:hypothetical protein F4811DRAFT_574193 [Daldinia bambusicola]|nr:hypothetical protein F4811DRAFT_574193 [Daldinia bambusicola]
MVKLRGDAKSWRAKSNLAALYGIPEVFDREGRRIDDYGPSRSSKEDEPKQDNKQRRISGRKGNVVIDSDKVIHKKPAKSYKTSSKKHIPIRYVSESDSDESSESTEVVVPKHSKGKRHASAKHVQSRKAAKKTAKPAPCLMSDSYSSEEEAEDSDSKETVMPKRIKNKKRATVKHTSASKVAKKPTKLPPPLESKSDSSDAGEDDESEPEEVTIPPPSRRRKQATTMEVKKTSKPSTPPSSDSGSSEKESEEQSDEGSEEDINSKGSSSGNGNFSIKNDTGKRNRRNLATIEMDGYRDKDWDVEEDKLICQMKERGESSRKIARLIKREVKDVQARVQEITELAEEGGLTLQRLGELCRMDQMKGKCGSKPKRQACSDTATNDSGGRVFKSKDSGKGMSKASDTTSSRGTTSSRSTTSTNSSRSKGDKPSNSAKSKSSSVKSWLNSIASSSSKPSSLSSSSSIASAYTYGTLPPVSVPAEDRLDIHSTLARAYPNQRAFYPDGVFSVQDCHALAIAEARYRGQQYARIRAEFASLTGRYLDTEVIKAKLAQGIDPRNSAYVNYSGL